MSQNMHTSAGAVKKIFKAPPGFHTSATEVGSQPANCTAGYLMAQHSVLVHHHEFSADSQRKQEAPQKEEKSFDVQPGGIPQECQQFL
jgi:hypothetical protein